MCVYVLFFFVCVCEIVSLCLYQWVCIPMNSYVEVCGNLRVCFRVLQEKHAACAKCQVDLTQVMEKIEQKIDERWDM